MLKRHVLDTAKAVLATGQPRYTGFLNEREAGLAVAALNKAANCTGTFFGGYEGAERQMLCVFESNCGESPAFPIAVLAVTVPNQQLTHRDYLGAVLGLGLQRSCIGDILPNEAGAVMYVQASIAEYIITGLQQVGRGNAAVQYCNAPQPPKQQATVQVQASVASLRVDAVLAAMLHISRKDAEALVAKGLLQINHMQVTSRHYQVQAGDNFSVRGTGKYSLVSIGGTSRKNRTFITYTQY